MKHLLLWLLLALTTTPMYAQAPPTFDPTDEIQTANLKGLRSLGVVVALSADLKASGLGEDEIKADTERRLKESGIRVLNAKERLQTPGRPYVYITIVSACKETTNVCAVEIGVRVMESIRLQRDSTIETNAAVWRQDSLRVVERNEIRSVRAAVSEFVENLKAAIQVANR